MPDAVVEAPPAPPKPPVDPEFAQIFRDFGKILDEDKPAEKKTLPDTMPARQTLGEAVKNAEEKRKAQEEEAKNKPAESTVADATDGKDDKKEPPAKEEPKPAVSPAIQVEVKTKESAEKELQTLIDNRLKDAMAKMPVATPSPAKEEPKPAEKSPEDEYEKSLGEIEQEELRFARYAAQKDQGFKDYPKQLVEYYKKIDAQIEKDRKENPERTFDDDTDPEWKKWKQENRPKVSPVLRRKLEREQILEEATVAAEARLQPKYAEVAKRQELLEKRPVIEKITQEFSTGLNEIMEATMEGDEPLVAPIVKRVKEVGWPKVLEEDPLFAPIVQRVTHTANKLASDYLGLVNKTIEFDASNSDHVWLNDFITKQGKEFAANGGDATVRDGRKFLPRAEFYNLANAEPERAAQHWTWTDADMLNRIAVNAKRNASNMIKIENNKLAKAGFERRKPEPAKEKFPKPENKTVEEVKGNGSPKAPSSAAPGLAQPAKLNGAPGAFTPQDIDAIIPGWKPGSLPS